MSTPNDIGLMYNDGTKGFMDWDAPWYMDELEFYVDSGSDYSNSSLQDGTIGEDDSSDSSASTIPPPFNLRVID